MSYIIDFTNKLKTPIIVDDQSIDNTTDITLFGRKELAYGQSLQENLLHILENFSCPEDPANPGNPSLSDAVENIFQHVIEGQFWYNSTKQKINFWNGTDWIPLSEKDDIAANSGLIFDGEFLPLPVSALTGRTFTYSECIWIASSFNIPQLVDYVVCEVSNAGQVTSQYKFNGSDNLISGFANYMIVGIVDNINQPQPSIPVSPTPTPTPTITISPSLTPSVTPTRSVGTTVTPTPTASHTVTPSVTRTPVASVTPTPAPTSTPTPSPSIPAVGPLPFQGQSFTAEGQAAGEKGGGGCTSTIQITFGSNGQYVIAPSVVAPSGGASIGASGTWLPTGWTVANSEIQFVVTGLTTTGSNPANIANSAPSYASLSVNQNWSMQGVCAAGSAHDEGSACTLTITIMNTATGHAFATSCSIEVDAGSGL